MNNIVITTFDIIIYTGAIIALGVGAYVVFRFLKTSIKRKR